MGSDRAPHVNRTPRQAILLAFDDTDSRTGGCTTHLAFHVLLALPDLALTGMPRLVRLNPNVPHKTRGNAAVVLPLGRPEGPSTRVGELRGREILAFPESPPATPTDDILDRAWSAIDKVAQPDAHPSVALFADAPPPLTYWEAVRTRSDPPSAAAALKSLGARWKGRDQLPRSLVGCLAAAAWSGPASSYEFIAYREPPRWGTERAVQPAALMGLDATGATFHTVDPLEGRLVCVPHGPDPVLVGLRGRDPDFLLRAATTNLPLAVAEPIDGWLLWATNQASGDHITPVGTVGEAPEWGTIQIEATVADMPVNHHGGHVELPLHDATGSRFSAMAFEPTKSLRDIVRALRPGDGVTAVGGWGQDEATLTWAVRLEKLQVLHLAEHLVKQANPTCPVCGRSMKSAGVGQGYRCRDCKTKAPAEAAGWAPEPRTAAVGWHEVPVIARRHLHRPTAWGVGRGGVGRAGVPIARP